MVQRSANHANTAYEQSGTSVLAQQQRLLCRRPLVHFQEQGLSLKPQALVEW